MNKVGNKLRLIMGVVINIRKIHFWRRNIIRILILRLEINRRVENRRNSFNYVYLRRYLILPIFLLNNRNKNKNRNKSRKNNNIKHETKKTHNYKNPPNPNLPPYQHQSQCQTQINSPKTTQT